MDRYNLSCYLFYIFVDQLLVLLKFKQRIYSRVVRICKHDQGLENYDYAAIMLPAPFSQDLGSFSFGVFVDSDLTNKMVNVPGYPSDKPKGTIWYDNRVIGSMNENKIYYAADTAGGQSGCPVYIVDEGQRIAIAIHAYGGNTANSGTRISPEVFTNLESWKEG